MLGRITNANGAAVNANHGENEDKTLLDNEQESYATLASTESDQFATGSQDVTEEEEINQPWPATYERSAEILAQPIVGRELVIKATESMRFLPPTKLRRNTSVSNLNRGWRTPDPTSKPVAIDGDDIEEDEEEGGIFQRMGVIRTFSLDWRHRLNGPTVPFQEGKQETASETAQKYRARLLQERKQEIPSETSGATEKGDDDPKKRLIESDEKKSGDDSDDGSKTSFSGTVCNVANTLLGIGILGLPFVFSVAGWAGGLFSLVSFGIVAWWTSILLVRGLNGDPRPRHVFDRNPTKSPHKPRGKHRRLRKPIKSFPALAREAFGQKGTVLLSSVMYFELFSCLAVFIVSMGDHMQSLFPSISATNHMVLVSVFLMVATVLFSTPKLISYLSMVGTFTTIAVVLSVFCAAILEGNIASEIAQQQLQQPHHAQVSPPPYHTAWITAGLPIGYGLVAFCFSGHAVIPSIYNSMAQPEKFEGMVTLTFSLVMVCCTTVAASGYYMFGSTVSDQVTISLHNSPQLNESFLTLLTWLMIFTVFSKFSLYIFPLALGLEEIIAPLVQTDRSMETSYSVIKFALIVSALGVAVFIPSFAFLCTLVGLICSVIVSVVFPAAAHLKLFHSHLPLWEKVIDWLLIVCGVIFGIVGTIAAVIDAV